MAPNKYEVVEQAGYVEERVVYESISYLIASRWIEKNYRDDEIQDLRVNIRIVFPDGTMEFMS